MNPSLSVPGKWRSMRLGLLVTAAILAVALLGVYVVAKPYVREARLRGRLKQLGCGFDEQPDKDWPLLRVTTRIDASNSAVTNADLTFIGAAARLTNLTLDDTKITDEGIKLLAKQPSRQRLARLSLKRTAVTDRCLAEIAGFAALSQLDLSQTQVTGAGITQLGSIPQLHQLTLRGRGTVLTRDALQQIGTLKLSSLDFTGAEIEEAGLCYLKNAPELRLAETNVTDVGVEQLAGCTQLRILDLTGTNISGQALRTVGALPELRVLCLGTTTILDADLKYLSKLVQLNILTIDQCQITDAGIDSLLKLHELELIDLSATRVTDDGVRRLQQLPKLKQVSHSRDSSSEGLEFPVPSPEVSP